VLNTRPTARACSAAPTLVSPFPADQNRGTLTSPVSLATQQGPAAAAPRPGCPSARAPRGQHHPDEPVSLRAEHILEACPATAGMSSLGRDRVCPRVAHFLPEHAPSTSSTSDPLIMISKGHSCHNPLIPRSLPTSHGRMQEQRPNPATPAGSGRDWAPPILTESWVSLSKTIITHQEPITRQPSSSHCFPHERNASAPIHTTQAPQKLLTNSPSISTDRVSSLHKSAHPPGKSQPPKASVDRFAVPPRQWR
jgi:hypothetical protein